MPSFDAAALAEIVVTYALERSYARISPSRHADSPFGFGVSTSRFSGLPLDSDPDKAAFGALYLAGSVRTATAETIVRNRSAEQNGLTLHIDELTSRVLFRYGGSGEPMNLVDLRRDNLMRAALRPNVIHDQDHTQGQMLSDFVYHHLPDVDGILYPSWFTQEDCVALYERGLDKIAHIHTMPLINHKAVMETLDRYKVRYRRTLEA